MRIYLGLGCKVKGFYQVKGVVFVAVILTAAFSGMTGMPVFLGG